MKSNRLKVWTKINKEEAKRLYIQAINDGWSLPMSRKKAGLTDHAFRKLFSKDPEIKEIVSEYIFRKNEQQRHPVDRRT